MCRQRGPLHLLDAVGVPQRVHRLLEILLRRTHTSNHGRVAPPCETLPQDLCQYGVTERHVLLLVADGTDASAQDGQALVDVDTLESPLSVGVRASHGLGASQVHQAQAVLGSGAVGLVGAADGDAEDGVGAGAGRVVGSGAGAAGFRALVQLLGGFIGRTDHLIRQVSNGKFYNT